jgi:hypothetical protein
MTRPEPRNLLTHWPAYQKSKPAFVSQVTIRFGADRTTALSLVRQSRLRFARHCFFAGFPDRVQTPMATECSLGGGPLTAA